MDENSTETGLPEEITKALESIQGAADMADPIVDIVRAVKEMGFGEKAAEVVEMFVDELGVVFKPISEKYRAYVEDRRDRRVAFIKKSTNNSTLSEDAALALLAMEQNEHAMFMKNLETEFWKFQSKRSEQKMEVQEKVRKSSDLLTQIMGSVKARGNA
jgi:hypothetical protein